MAVQALQGEEGEEAEVAQEKHKEYPPCKDGSKMVRAEKIKHRFEMRKLLPLYDYLAEVETKIIPWFRSNLNCVLLINIQTTLTSLSKDVIEQ